MQIVEQPDIFLREPTSKVKFPLSPEDQVIIDQMIDTMYRNHGIGLAANQVGYARRMFVIDTSTNHNSPCGRHSKNPYEHQSDTSELSDTI